MPEAVISPQLLQWTWQTDNENLFNEIFDFSAVEVAIMKLNSQIANSDLAAAESRLRSDIRLPQYPPLIISFERGLAHESSIASLRQRWSVNSSRPNKLFDMIFTCPVKK